MKEKLGKVWESRAPRERTLLLVVGLGIGILLYLALLISAHETRPRLRNSVLALRADAARLDKYAEEVERLRATRAPASSSTDLRTLLQAGAASAGIAGAVVRLDAADSNHVQVVFGAVPFQAWLRWAAALREQNIRLESCRIETLSQSGMVSITAAFVRSGRQ